MNLSSTGASFISSGLRNEECDHSVGNGGKECTGVAMAADKTSGGAAEVNMDELGVSWEETTKEVGMRQGAGVALPQVEGAAEKPACGVVRSVNVSTRKGTRKTPVAGGMVHVRAQEGIEGDAHAGGWHRQVSLLAWESICKAQAMGLDVKEGDFAENVTSEGIDLLALPLGTHLRVGQVLLELSQIGKVCHNKCAIYHLAGDCIFPREGVFFVAVEGGDIAVGDRIFVERMGNGTCDFTPPEALAELARTQSV